MCLGGDPLERGSLYFDITTFYYRSKLIRIVVSVVAVVGRG